MGALGWFKGERGYVRLAVLVILAGALLRFGLAALSHPSGDGCFHLSAARFIAEHGRIPFQDPFGDGREVFWAPPLFHLVAAAVYGVVSTSSVRAAEFAMKLVSPLFGVLTLPFIFLTVKKLFRSAKLAFLASFFVTFLPLHVYASTVSFVDSFATFFTTSAIYFVLDKKLLLAAILAGLSLSAKQNALFILPVFFVALFFTYRAGLSSFVKKALASALAIATVGCPWFIRNFLLLGNPFWPFLYKVFGGTIAPKAVESNFSFNYLLSPGVHSIQFYLEFFGVPSGSIAALSFVQLPFMNALLLAWFGATLLFFVPLIVGFFVKRNSHRVFLFAWLLSFFAMLLLYVMNLNMAFARLALPAIPAIAIFWALGFEKIAGYLGRFRLGGLGLSSLFVVIIVGCAAGFAVAEVVKTQVAANAWGAYEPDFQWIREHTPRDALVGYRGQCLSYNIDRLSNYDLRKVNYAWVNQNFRLEPISIVQPFYVQELEQNFQLVYDNPATGTKFYKRK